MSDLHRALDEYLAIRRRLGFTLRLPASLLRNFVAFVECSRGAFITTDLAVQ
jgi:integrase/recombinase XerD